MTIKLGNQWYLKAERRLKDFLLAYYDPQIRPNYNTSKSTTVQLGMSLKQIVQLDEWKEVLGTYVWLRMFWKDEHFKWNASDYDGISQIRLPSNFVWTPDIFLYNNAHPDFARFSSKAFVTVTSDGSIMWLPPAELATFCKLDYSRFPFDDQFCEIILGSWNYNGVELKLELHDEHEIYLGEYWESTEWKVLGTEAVIHEIAYPCCPDEPVHLAKFFLKIRRNSMPYVKMTVLPCIVMQVITLLMLWLPVCSRERMVSIMLSFVALTVISISVEEFMPMKFTPSSPLIVCIYDFTMLLLLLLILESVIVSNMHHRQIKRSIPAWVRTVFLRLLTLVTFVDTTDVRQAAVRSRSAHNESGNSEDSPERHEQKKQAALAVIAEEWKIIGIVVDRCTFILMLVCYIISWIAFSAQAKT